MMADIVSGSGRRITDNAATLQPVHSQPSQWIWPREEPCRTLDLDAWRKGLHLISSPNFWLPRQQHLGAWLRQPHKVWEWFHDPFLDELYRRVPGGWQTYGLLSIERSRYLRWTCNEEEAPFPTLPPDLHRATALLDGYG
jgi:hypothetical protein